MALFTSPYTDNKTLISGLDSKHFILLLFKISLCNLEKRYMTMKKVDLNTTFIFNWPYKKGTCTDLMGTELFPSPTAQLPKIKDRISNHQKYD